MLSITHLAFDNKGNRIESHVAISLQEIRDLQQNLQAAFNSMSKLSPHISPKAPARNQHLQKISQVRAMVNQLIPDEV